ncbi:MAG: hypothetical protein QXS54_08200 [Candidatus Methanomethylicaceae archaeon]
MTRKTLYSREEEMYPEVAAWLHSYLRQSARGSSVRVLVAHRKKLNSLIRDQLSTAQQQSLPLGWQSWDVQVDVVGFALDEHRARLAVVECKLSQVNLAHLSQLVGYVRVVNPDWAFLLSPQGIHARLRRLLAVYNRKDILYYGDLCRNSPKHIIVAKWLRQGKQGQLDWHSAIPQGLGAVRHL